MSGHHDEAEIAMNSSYEGPSVWRVSILVVGWTVAIAGALSIFSVPLYLSFVLLVGGTTLGALAYRNPPPMTWRSWAMLIAGCVIIICVLNLFGQERIRHWTPHPAGYIPAWFVCFHAFQQMRHLLRDRAKLWPSPHSAR
jgi:hypothetical protein